MSDNKVRIRSDRYTDEKEVTIFKTRVPDDVATFAFLLIEKHAMVAAVPDGEDSAGRSRLRLQSPEELVERSFRIARQAYETAAGLGHMIPLPDLNELNAEHDAKESAKLEARKS